MINDELLHKWVNNTISESELEVFKTRPEYESLVKLYEQTESLTGPELDSETMLATILATDKASTTNQYNKTTGKSKLIPLWMKLTAAASILLIAGLFLLSPKDNMITLQGKEGFAEVLPDGTRIEINASSTITYDKEKFKKERTVSMTGIALFEVEKGSPFKVNSNNGNIEVLGTSFLVSDIEEIFQVYCNHGKVKVQSKYSKGEATLEANEFFTTYKQGGSVLIKKNFTKLKNIPLHTAIREIENRFDVKIELKNIDKEQIITSGFQYDVAENAIKTITMPLNLKSERQGNTFIISK